MPRLAFTERREEGFSMVELLVTISIFIFICSFILGRYNSCNKRLALDTMVHESAQWVRQTQISAMSVRKAGNNSFNVGYGLHFDRAVPGSFTFFSDRNNNQRYDNGEAEQVITLPKDVSIKILCGDTTPEISDSNCAPNSGADTFDIVFTRPNPDAEIIGTHYATAQEYSEAVITFASAIKGYERRVEVWTTGQVDIK